MEASSDVGRCSLVWRVTKGPGIGEQWWLRVCSWDVFLLTPTLLPQTKLSRGKREHSWEEGARALQLLPVINI